MIETINIKNGPTLYLYNDLRRHSTFFDITTKFGGIVKDFKVNDKEYHMQDGVAHILEHYVVENNEVGNFLKLLGDMQMNTNASTSKYHTDYYFSAVEDYLNGIKTMLDGIYSVQFSKEKLEKIKNPICQEIKGRQTNRYYYLSNKENENLFYGSSFRNIGGSIDEVKNTTINDVKVCYKTFYQPSNQVIFIGGNFDRDKTISFIKDYYKKLNFKNIDFEIIKNEEKDEVVKKEDIIYFPVEQDVVTISFKINMSKYSNKERLDYDFFLPSFYRMFFGVSSSLYKKLIKDKIITGRISTTSEYFGDYLIIDVRTSTDNSKEFIDGVFNTINSLNEFNKEIFELDKSNTIVSLILRDENIAETLFPFMDNVLYYDYPYIDKISDIEEMTYEKFVDSIKELDFSNYTITTITNEK